MEKDQTQYASDTEQNIPTTGENELDFPKEMMSISMPSI